MDFAEKITAKPGSMAESRKNLSHTRLDLESRLSAMGMARLRALETFILESLPVEQQAACVSRLDDLTMQFRGQGGECP